MGHFFLALPLPNVIDLLRILIKKPRVLQGFICVFYYSLPRGSDVVGSEATGSEEIGSTIGSSSTGSS